MKISKAIAVCRALPGATQDIKWGADLVFSVGGKMFAVTSKEPGAKGMSFKVEDERFLELTDRDGIIPAPYLARARWVYVEDMGKLSDAEGKALLTTAHALIFAKLTKKAQREILGV